MCSIDWTVLAAWVQAVGSVGAIFVAIWIGERQANRTKESADLERARQGAVMATGLASALYQLKLDTQLKLHVLRGIARQVPQSGNFVLSNAEELNASMGLQEPPPLASMLAWTAALDREPAQAAILVTQSAEIARRTLHRMLQMLTRTPAPAGDARNHFADMIGKLEQLEEQIERAMSALNPIHKMEGQSAAPPAP